MFFASLYPYKPLKISVFYKSTEFSILGLQTLKISDIMPIARNDWQKGNTNKNERRLKDAS
jgi:hypothetical protein